MRKVYPPVHGGELQNFIRRLFAMHGRIKNVDGDHRARAVVKNGVQRLRDGEALKRRAEFGRVIRGEYLDRFVHGAGRRDPHQADHGGFHDGDGHAAVLDFDRLHAVQEIGGHYASSFPAAGGAVFAVSFLA